MNLKPNQHERIPFDRTTMTSLWFIDPQLFWSEIFRSPLKLGRREGREGGRAATMNSISIHLWSEFLTATYGGSIFRGVANTVRHVA